MLSLDASPIASAQWKQQDTCLYSCKPTDFCPLPLVEEFLCFRNLPYFHQQPPCLQCNQQPLEDTLTFPLLRQNCPAHGDFHLVPTVPAATGIACRINLVTQLHGMYFNVARGKSVINKEGVEASLVSHGARECSETVLVHHSSSPACDTPSMEQPQQWDLLVRSWDSSWQNL